MPGQCRGKTTVERFNAELRQYWKNRPFVWGGVEDVSVSKVSLPTCGRALVLGPHPDDPESVGVTCRLLMQSGCDIWYAIVSMSPSGVEDEYAQKQGNSESISLEDKKIQIRQREQTRSAEMFGLTADKVVFLSIEEGEKLACHENLARIKNHLESVAPDIMIMPIGNDTNQMHAWVYQIFRKFARDLTRKIGKPIVALYNEDPKTTEIRPDLFVLFDEERAEWKRTLLRIHDSQQQRNIHMRFKGFDERILRMNRLSYKRLSEFSLPSGSSARYAEMFQIELFEYP
jgi:LmbE family N-acetylglucosaminyl deacetylase